MSTVHEVAAIIRAGDQFKEERIKTFKFAEMTGRPILPIEVLGKGTLGDEQTDLNWHPDKLSIWRNEIQIAALNNKQDLNVGVLFGDNVIDIDIDSTDDKLLAALNHYLGRFPTPYKWGREGKPLSHIAYALLDPFDRALHARAIKALAEFEELKVELRGGDSRSNFFAVMPGSIHSTGQLIKWDKQFDPGVTVAPILDVVPILTALRRAVSAALYARYAIEGSRHSYFLALTGTFVRMWKQAEDSERPETAMNQEEALEQFHLIQKLSGDTDHRDKSFNETWRKFMDDPTIPISGGTKLAELISKAGGNGPAVRNLGYKLLVDDDGFEQAEAAIERFVMLRTPSAGVLDLETLKPHIRITGAMKDTDLSMLFTSMKIPFGDKTIPLPAFLKHSSQVTKATGLELRPDMPPRTIFKIERNREEHGYDDESIWVNAWTGFQYWPSEGAVSDSDVQPFLDYMLEVISNNDQERNRWVMSWIADIFQDPANKPGTLLVLTGPQGSGKTMLGEIIGKIIGDAHYGKIGSIEDLTKEFNSRVHYKLFVQADETASTQKTAIARDLKELVTGSYQTIVYKGKEGLASFNPARYFFTSNNSDDALRVEAGNERRYTIFETSGVRVGDQAYWDKFATWWAQGKTLRALHRYFRDYKYDKSLIRRALGTDEKKQHQMNAMPPVIQWALQRADEGYPIAAENHQHSYQAYRADMVKTGVRTQVSPAPNRVDRMEWPNLVELQALTDDFHLWLKNANIRQMQPNTAVSKFLSEVRGGGRMEYNSITALRDGVKIRPKLMRFPTRQEYIDGIARMFPSLKDEIFARTEAAEELEVTGEDDSGEF